MPSTTELLKNVAIFKDLDETELAAVAEVCKEEKHESGAYIFREGEAGNRLYVIVSGEVRISRDVPGSGEEALAVLKPGALFGEMSVFDRSDRSTHAISNGGCTLMTIMRPDFEMLLDFNREHPGETYRVDLFGVCLSGPLSIELREVPYGRIFP